MKIIFLFIILIFALVVAMALMGRLLKTQTQLADLHKKLATNDEELANHRRELERIAANEEAKKQDKS
jgi:Tfp pilus assembly protein PilO